MTQIDYIVAQCQQALYHPHKTYSIGLDIPQVSKVGLLYGLLHQGEAYLIPTWPMQEQRLAQVQINQSINRSKQTAAQQSISYDAVTCEPT